MRNPTPNSSPVTSERRIVLFLAGLSLLLASLPVLFGYAIYGQNFIGAAYNIDDFCNYLSWLQQTSHGHFFVRNLFTTDPQLGKQVYLLFSLLGLIAQITHLPEAVVLQITKFLAGVGLLYLIYRFYLFCVPNHRYARLTAFAFACLSSGLGWVSAGQWAERNPPGSPVDAWQPEAFTFLSLETSTLFCVSTILILGTIYALLLGERTGRWRYALIAGVCAALLGNIHSYDILHISAAWGLFLLVWTAIKRGRGVGASWGRAIVALILALPTTLYVFYAFTVDPVFHERAEVKTLSPPFAHYLWGYGIVFLLAVVGVVLLILRTRIKASDFKTNPEDEDGEIEEPLPAPFADQQALLLVVCWAIAGFLIIYLKDLHGHPVPFQRKMIMGEHIPLCLLAGVGIALATRKLHDTERLLALVFCVLITVPSSILFVRRDLNNLSHNRSETQAQPILFDTMLSSFDWIRKNTPENAAILGIPFECAYIPGLTGRTVWAGHWGETPQFGHKVSEFNRFADMAEPDEERRAFLISTHTQYLWYPNNVTRFQWTDKYGNTHSYSDFAHQAPSYLTPVYSNKDYTVFEIHL